MNPNSFQNENTQPENGNFLVSLFNSSDLFRKILETLSTRFLLIVIGFATTVIITRTLGPEGRGIYAMALTVGLLGVQLSNLGLHASNTFFVGKEPGNYPSLLGNTLSVCIIYGTLVSICLAATFYFIPSLAPIKGPILNLSLIWIPLGLAYLLSQNLLLGIHKVRAYNQAELISKAFFAVVVIALVYFEKVTPMTIFVGIFLSLLLKLAMALSTLFNNLATSLSVSFSLFKESLSYGLKSYLTSLTSFLLFRIDLLMINYLLGTKSAGFYDIAVGLADLFFVLADVVSTILFPRLCSLKTTGEKWQLARKTGYALGLAMAALCLLGAFASKPLITILYGDAFLPSVTPFIILIGCKFLLSINCIFNNFIYSIEAPWKAVPFGFFLVTMNVVLNYYFIQNMGISGAAYASVISFGMLLVFNMAYSSIFIKTNKETI